MLPGQPVYNEVVRHFGGGILNPDLSVNRAKLAEAAFGSSTSPATPSRVLELNRIVHPAVIRSQEEWMEEMGRQNAQAVAIVEAALLIEAGAAKRFDRLIVVTCSEEQRVARFAARQKINHRHCRHYSKDSTRNRQSQASSPIQSVQRWISQVSRIRP